MRSELICLTSVLLCCVGRIVCDQVYFTSYSQSTSLKELQEKLSNSNHALFSKPKPSAPSNVAEWLGNTEKKSEPKTILGMFSINELLELNDLFEEQCTTFHLSRRERTCQLLDSNRILSTYCKGCLDMFEAFCGSIARGIFNEGPDEDYDPRVRVNIDPFHRKELISFKTGVRRWMEKFHQSKKESVLAVLDRFEQSKRNETVAACNHLIKEFKEQAHVDQPNQIRPWGDVYELCMIATELVAP
jgi:hypothetical protein